MTTITLPTEVKRFTSASDLDRIRSQVKNGTKIEGCNWNCCPSATPTIRRLKNSSRVPCVTRTVRSSPTDKLLRKAVLRSMITSEARSVLSCWPSTTPGSPECPGSTPSRATLMGSTPSGRIRDALDVPTIPASATPATRRTAAKRSLSRRLAAMTLSDFA